MPTALNRSNVLIPISPFDGYGEADVEEILIPIRLDIQNDGYRICDTFVWNVNGKLTPRIPV